MRVIACAPLDQSLDLTCIVIAWDPVVCHSDNM